MSKHVNTKPLAMFALFYGPMLPLTIQVILIPLGFVPMQVQLIPMVILYVALITGWAWPIKIRHVDCHCIHIHLPGSTSLVIVMVDIPRIPLTLI